METDEFATREVLVINHKQADGKLELLYHEAIDIMGAAQTLRELLAREQMQPTGKRGTVSARFTVITENYWNQLEDVQR